LGKFPLSLILIYLHPDFHLKYANAKNSAVILFFTEASIMYYLNFHLKYMHYLKTN